jgi:hypothetical protein
MKFQITKIIPKIIGFLLWLCCLISFPVVWAIITIALGAFQLAKCERFNSTVNKMFQKRTNQKLPLGYIEDDK